MVMECAFPQKNRCPKKSERPGFVGREEGIAAYDIAQVEYEKPFPTPKG